MNVLCRDCKHCVPESHYKFSELGGHEWFTYHDARCALTDVVTGTGVAGRLCVEERAPTASIGTTCGPFGDHFEAAPPPKPMPRLVEVTKSRWWHGWFAWPSR